MSPWPGSLLWALTGGTYWNLIDPGWYELLGTTLQCLLLIDVSLTNLLFLPSLSLFIPFLPTPSFFLAHHGFGTVTRTYSIYGSLPSLDMVAVSRLDKLNNPERTYTNDHG